MQVTTIGVVGAGPAGLAAAILLARQGRRVTLFDQFDAPKPVGSGLMLQPGGLAVLAALGLAGEIRALGQPIDRLFGRAVDGDRVALDVRYGALRGAGGALAVHRAALFDVLWRAARAERFPVATGAEITELMRRADGRPVLRDARGRRHGPFDMIVDASGAHAPLRASAGISPKIAPLAYGALWATLPWSDAVGAAFRKTWLEQRYRHAEQMAGVLPVGRIEPQGPELATYFWSLKPALYADWLSGGMAAWKAEAAALWPETGPLLDGLEDPEQLTLARYAHFTVARPFAERFVLIGDAAHATSPQLGQGANMALMDAWALATALRAEPSLDLALAGYAAARRWHVRIYQAMSRVFTPAYQSDGRWLPWLRDRLAAPLAAAPATPRLLARLVSGALVDPYAGGPAPQETLSEPSPIGGLRDSLAG